MSSHAGAGLSPLLRSRRRERGPALRLLQRGKETVSFEILAQGTQAGTAGRHRDILRQDELLLKGIDSITIPLMESIPLQEFAFCAVSSR